MLQCYNHSTLEIKHSKADSVALKTLNSAVMLYDLVNGVVTINTDNFTIGEYAVQFFKDDQVIEETTLICKQNLKYVSANYDPRTPAKIILEAIEAYLAGVATHQQKRVKVGQKEIQYSSYDQLMKWRDFYAIEARKEQGKAGNLRFEKISWRGI